MAKRISREQLAAGIQAYFAQCDATQERVQLKNGGISVRQVPYTRAGLASSLGLTVAALNALAAGKAGKQTGELVSAALLRVERYLLERALMGELAASAAALLLREFGYGLDAEADDAGRCIVLLGDKAGWSE